MHLEFQNYNRKIKKRKLIKRRTVSRSGLPMRRMGSGWPCLNAAVSSSNAFTWMEYGRAACIVVIIVIYGSLVEVKDYA